MGPLALCWMMNYLSIMQVTAPLMGSSFYLHPHWLLPLYLLYSRFIYMVICTVITGMSSLMSLCTLHFCYCFFMCQNLWCFPSSLPVFLPSRDLSAHQGQTNRECACRHLLSTLLPLCRPFQWGARRVPHDATRFRNCRHWPTGPHW